MSRRRHVDWLFHGGAIHVDVPGSVTTHALAVTGDRIVATGDAAAALRGPSTEAVDLKGGALIPGFQDAHIHAVAGGLQQLGCNLEGVHGLEDYRKLIHLYADTHPDAEWIKGAGWYGDVFPGGFPHRDELDQLVPDRPAVIISHDAHGVWVNSEALRRAGIDRSAPDPAGGRIMRDAGGEPTGMLVESAADLVTGLLPATTAERLEEALMRAQSYLHSLGVTAWQDAAVGAALAIPDTYETYRSAASSGRLTARVTGALWWDRELGMDQLDLLMERRAAAATGRFRATAVKIMQDGVCENLTAAVVEPYHGHGDDTGLSFIDPAELVSVVRRLDDEGFDLHLHAVGDRAVRECLDAIPAGDRTRDARHQIAHIDLIRPEDVERMAALGSSRTSSRCGPARTGCWWRPSSRTSPSRRRSTTSRSGPWGAPECRWPWGRTGRCPARTRCGASTRR